LSSAENLASSTIYDKHTWPYIQKSSFLFEQLHIAERTVSLLAGKTLKLLPMPKVILLIDVPHCYQQKLSNRCVACVISLRLLAQAKTKKITHAGSISRKATKHVCARTNYTIENLVCHNIFSQTINKRRYKL